MQSTLVTSRRPQRFGGAQRRSRARGRHLVLDPGRSEVLGGSRRVARGVVVHARPSARSRRAAAVSSGDPISADGDLGARRSCVSTTAAPLNDRAAMTAAGRSASRSTNPTPSADPLLEGLTTHGSPTRSIAGPERRTRAQVPQRPTLDRDPRGCAARPPARARPWPGPCRRPPRNRRPPCPCTGSPSRSSRRCTVPSSPSLPCNAR